MGSTASYRPSSPPPRAEWELAPPQVELPEGWSADLGGDDWERLFYTEESHPRSTAEFTVLDQVRAARGRLSDAD
jgi:hypothetical protein